MPGTSALGADEEKLQYMGWLSKTYKEQNIPYGMIQLVYILESYRVTVSCTDGYKNIYGKYPSAVSNDSY